MATIITNSAAQNTLNKELGGANFDGIEYFIAGWVLRFVPAKGKDIILKAFDLTLDNIESWRHSLSNCPIDILETNEPDDGIVAIALFSALNKAQISSVKVDKNFNLMISFSNGVSVVAKGTDDVVDRCWEVELSTARLITDGGGIYKSKN